MPLPAAIFFIENFRRGEGDFTGLDEGRLLVFNGDSVVELGTSQECVYSVIQLFVGCPTPSLSCADCILEGGSVRLVPCWA